MRDLSGQLVLAFFVWSEIFAGLLFLFGAPIVVWLPVALFIPLLVAAAAVKVTYDLWKERRQK